MPSRRPPVRSLVAVAMVVAGGCGAEAPTPFVHATPTPGPPSIRTANTTFAFDGTRSTLHVVVDPHGIPTDVVLEYGASPETLNAVVPMAEDVTTAGDVSVVTSEVRPDVGCYRFTASNGAGSVSTGTSCAQDPSFRIVLPSPSG